MLTISLAVALVLFGTCAYIIASQTKAAEIGVALASLGLSALGQPGLRELKEEGCKRAFVLDGQLVDKFASLLPLTKPTRKPAATDAYPSVLVTCRLDSGIEPDCDKIAGAYAKVAPPELAQINVLASSRSDSRTNCYGVYDGQGRWLRDD